MRKLGRGLFGLTITAALVVGAVAFYTDAEAACRIQPECWTNVDCDSICGPGLGRCVHSKCPVRVCKCG